MRQRYLCPAEYTTKTKPKTKMYDNCPVLLWARICFALPNIVQISSSEHLIFSGVGWGSYYQNNWGEGMPRRRLVSACDQKNEPMIFLSSGAHSKPKLKLTLALGLVLGFIQSYDHICHIRFQGFKVWMNNFETWLNQTGIMKLIFQYHVNVDNSK